MLVQRRALTVSRRGTVIIVVLWALAVAALVTTGVQLFSFRQATLGREAVERAQARWAARAGVEYTIAVMADHTNRPDPEDAFSV
jgi:type II secretory pathway component PulK